MIYIINSLTGIRRLKELFIRIKQKLPVFLCKPRQPGSGNLIQIICQQILRLSLRRNETCNPDIMGFIRLPVFIQIRQIQILIPCHMSVAEKIIPFPVDSVKTALRHPSLGIKPVPFILKGKPTCMNRTIFPLVIPVMILPVLPSGIPASRRIHGKYLTASCQRENSQSCRCQNTFCFFYFTHF